MMNSSLTANFNGAELSCAEVGRGSDSASNSMRNDLTSRPCCEATRVLKLDYLDARLVRFRIRLQPAQFVAFFMRQNTLDTCWSCMRQRVRQDSSIHTSSGYARDVPTARDAWQRLRHRCVACRVQLRRVTTDPLQQFSSLLNEKLGLQRTIERCWAAFRTSGLSDLACLVCDVELTHVCHDYFCSTTVSRDHE
jgi:hypothetical protein